MTQTPRRKEGRHHAHFDDNVVVTPATPCPNCGRGFKWSMGCVVNPQGSSAPAPPPPHLSQDNMNQPMTQVQSLGDSEASARRSGDSPEMFDMNVSGSSDSQSSPLATKGARLPTMLHTPRSRKQAIDLRPGPAGNRTGNTAQDIYQFFENNGAQRDCIFCQYVL